MYLFKNCRYHGVFALAEPNWRCLRIVLLKVLECCAVGRNELNLDVGVNAHGPSIGIKEFGREFVDRGGNDLEFVSLD